MTISPRILQLADDLHKRGVSFPWDQGTYLCRSYADLGTEVFVLVGPRSVVSTFTGQRTEIAAEHERFFFRIPSTTELLEALFQGGWAVQELTFVDQRRWHLVCVEAGTSCEMFRTEGEDLEAVLLEALCERHIAGAPERKDRALRSEPLYALK